MTRWDWGGFVDLNVVTVGDVSVASAVEVEVGASAAVAGGSAVDDIDVHPQRFVILALASCVPVSLLQARQIPDYHGLRRESAGHSTELCRVAEAVGVACSIGWAEVGGRTWAPRPSVLPHHSRRGRMRCWNSRHCSHHAYSSLAVVGVVAAAAGAGLASHLARIERRGCLRRDQKYLHRGCRWQKSEVDSLGAAVA